jgi:hypothetical protein
MNHLLQPRIDPKCSQAYPFYALSGFYRLRHRLPAHSSNTPKYVCFNELTTQPLSPYANPRYPAHQKQLKHIQLP